MVIEDKETNTVIAENKEEAFWIRLKNKLIDDNVNMEKSIKINNHILQLVEIELKNIGK